MSIRADDETTPFFLPLAAEDSLSQLIYLLFQNYTRSLLPIEHNKRSKFEARTRKLGHISTSLVAQMFKDLNPSRVLSFNVISVLIITNILFRDTRIIKLCFHQGFSSCFCSQG